MDYKFSLKTARQYAGLTQAEMGKALGLSAPVIVAMEKADANPKPVYVDAWAKICNVAVEDIIFFAK